MLQQPWYGAADAAAFAPPPRSVRPIVMEQRVVIDEQHLSPHSQSSQSSLPLQSPPPPVVIADNVLAPPVPSGYVAGNGYVGGGVAGGGHDVIVETTPLVQQISWTAASSSSPASAPPEINGSSSDTMENNTTMPVYRDIPFAVLFGLHICIMAWLGMYIAPRGYTVMEDRATRIDWNDWKSQIMQDNDINITEENLHMIVSFIGQTVSYLQVYPTRIFFLLILPCIVLAFLSGWIVTSLFIRPCPRCIIYTSLIGTCILGAACGVTILLALLFSDDDDDDHHHHDSDDDDDDSTIGNYLLVIVALALFLGGMVYTLRFFWPRVAFCAVNLRVALIAIGAHNYGTYIVAFTFAVLGFAWVLYWIYVLVGTVAFANHQCRLAHPNANFDITSDDCDSVCDPSFFTLLLFLLSLHWTNTVIMNTIQVTVAGVMATWCFDKSLADTCCSWAIWGSLVRSLSYSFGSICLASLVQGFVCIFRFIVESAQQQRQRQQQIERSSGGCGCGCGVGGLCLCILECMAKILEPIVECLNQLALVYCGIYGYSYLESGRRVMQLMRTRGWTVVLNDQLSIIVLHLTTGLVAIMTGFAGVLVERVVSQYYAPYNMDAGDRNNNDELSSYIFGPLPQPAVWSFCLAFIIGLWVGSVMSSVLRGAVNTMIVCWADAPTAFEMQHPHLTQELAMGWNAVFPSVAAANVRPT